MNTKDKSKTALFVLTPGFPQSEHDDTCLTVVYKFVLAHREVFPDADVVVFSLGYPLTQQAYLWHGVKIKPFNLFRAGKLRKIFGFLQIVYRMAIEKRKYHDVRALSFWCGEAAFVGKLFEKLCGINHLIWMQGQEARGQSKWVRRIRPHPQQLLAISSFQAQLFKNNYRISPGHLVEAGIRTEDFPPLNDHRHIDLIAIGSLIPLKRFQIFIELVKDIADIKHDVRAVIVGEGPELEHLNKLIEIHELQGRISLVGKQSHHKTLALLNDSKVLVHPSEYEGFGSVFAEALYAGCKALSFVNPLQRRIEGWVICEDFAEMRNAAQKLLSQNITPKRTLVNNIGNTARQIDRIFKSWSCDENISYDRKIL